MAYTLNFHVNGKDYIESIDNTKDNATFVASLPLSIQFENYGSTERIAYLDPKLDILDNVSCTPIKGDLTYYVPWGNLAVFKKDFRHSNGLYYIGHLSEDLLDAIVNSGDSTVTIKLISK